MKYNPTITKIAGPLVEVTDAFEAKLYDVVKVGSLGLLGEVIEITDGVASVQVYEDTSGIQVGEPVELTGEPLSLTLGPGMMSEFYDGIQRPLKKLYDATGTFMTRGVDVASIDLNRKWKVTPLVKKGDSVSAGDVVAEVEETSSVVHKIMVPPTVSGEITSIIAKGESKVSDVIAKVKGDDKEHEIKMYQRWPIRTPRPVAQRLHATTLLTTGQRVIDTFFPVVRGGTASTPGPFGSGKTVIQHQLAKWSDADIVVYVGCGERGNEMTDALHELSELKDPRTGNSLLERTVLIANTSNMPVAAREASIYTGITIAEYYRDMGYDVALMADSTSRWAEALREISSRLEEMPGEEGYPAYLSSRVAAFYERAGIVTCLGKDQREGSITAIGAVSPPGGDLSEPVSQATLRVSKVFWALDGGLANARHYPAIHWLKSYSLYGDAADEYYTENGYADFPEMRERAMVILQEEAKLEEIVRVVGADSLSLTERLLIDTAKSLREDFLQQHAFDDVDSYSSLHKQYMMLKIILANHDLAEQMIAQSTDELSLEDITKHPVKEKIQQMKFVKEKKGVYESILSDLEKTFAKMTPSHEEDETPLHETITHREESN